MTNHGPKQNALPNPADTIFFSENLTFLESAQLGDAWSKALGPVAPRPRASWDQSQTKCLKATSETESFKHHIREMGFLYADTNPLEKPPALPASLRPTSDQDQTILKAYTGRMAPEITHKTPDAEKQFFYKAFESPNPNTSLQHSQETLKWLVRAHLFEKTLGKALPGLKRFSLEGAESVLPGLVSVLHQAAAANFQNIVLGTTHRGRLSLLHHLLGYPLANFKAQAPDPSKKLETATGDVPYHQGLDGTFVSGDKQLLLHLLPNPSHLGATVPVMMGYARGLFDQGIRTLGICLHGDAAFAGQGVVSESLLLGRASGYDSGGTIHVILNNQLGFTANPDEAYANNPLAPALGQNIPILHVNSLCPTSVIHAFDLAFHYKTRFQKDVLINLLCFRRHGHNEMDQPRITNPLAYKTIDDLPPCYQSYQKQINASTFMLKQIEEPLKAHYADSLEDAPPPIEKITPDVQETRPPALGANHLTDIGKTLTRYPDILKKRGFVLHQQLIRTLESRAQMIAGNKPVDWAFAESLAFGTLLTHGISVRLTGQDSARGTFTQRHGTWVCQETGERHYPHQRLSGLQKNQSAPATFDLINSPLSEAAALGFEFGHAWASPKSLTIWEAQFGDFINGAQVHIDQYLVSSRDKWKRHNNLVLMLPHGYEGQGPEHSSARLERFLSLYANKNIRVCMPTQPHNLFHLLRHQAYQTDKKPLVLMTPKSLLRHPLATSHLDSFVGKNAFTPVLAYGIENAPSHIILCSGKIAVDLRASLDKEESSHTKPLILCLEQLAPFPAEAISALLKPLSAAPCSPVFWVQEEPQNMGAWSFVRKNLMRLQKGAGENSIWNWLETPQYVGRPESTSPATGFGPCHQAEQSFILSQALRGCLQ